MAETKDYVGILWQDQSSWIGSTPEQTLENIKRRLIQEGAKPGTPEYQEAFMNILNRATMGSGGGKQRAGGLVLEPNMAGSEALNYLRTEAGAKKAGDLGVDPILYGLGGAIRRGGNVLFPSDIPGAGDTLYNEKTGETVVIANLDVLPEWFNPSALPGFAEAGIGPGTKVTPEVRATIRKLMGVTGAPTAGAGAGTATVGAVPGTTMSGAATGTLTNPFAPGTAAAKAWDERKSAYDLLFQEFNRYGLGSLVQDIRSLITEDVSPSEFSIRLRQTEPYKKRFAANAQRITKGLSALNEAQYIALEDQYQDVMRRYGLPSSYYARGDMGRQEGFEKFIGQDVSPVELEDRIQTAQNRVLYANPEVSIALKNFYPDITNGDILAYALDPDKGLANIKRRITAAEIGGSAVQLGLTTNETDAEYLARYGVTKEQAQQGYRTIAGGLQRGRELSSIYAGQGVEPYTQATAEREVFNVPGAVEAEKQRKKIIGLERATFGGQTGATGGALARERAGGF